MAAAADEENSVERAEAELNVTVTDQTSADFLLSQGFIERFANDPLGGRCSAAEIVDPIQNQRGS